MELRIIIILVCVNDYYHASFHIYVYFFKVYIKFAFIIISPCMWNQCLSLFKPLFLFLLSNSNSIITSGYPYLVYILDNSISEY
jgi:hypothetical protein